MQTLCWISVFKGQMGSKHDQAFFMTLLTTNNRTVHKLFLLCLASFHFFYFQNLNILVNIFRFTADYIFWSFGVIEFI